MARFTPDNEEHKQAMIERALKLKPRHNGPIVATERGWMTPHANGYLELLVSFAGLDELLGSASTADQEVEAEPVEVQAEPATEVVEETIEEASEKASEEQVTEAPKKKGGRPPKKVAEAAEQTTEEKAPE